MEKQKMTIHRALAELKLIDGRIEKAIQNIDPSGVMTTDGLVNGFYKKEDFETTAKSQLQSVTDLIDRKIKIKSAIVNANCITKVSIAGKEMTIADAINFKLLIEYKTELITFLKKKHNAAKGKVVTENEKIQSDALNNARIILGRTTEQSVNPTDTDVKAIVEPFVKRKELLLVDPLNAETTIADLEKEVGDFASEVDAVLSEINAITIIEI